LWLSAKRLSNLIIHCVHSPRAFQRLHQLPARRKYRLHLLRHFHPTFRLLIPRLRHPLYRRYLLHSNQRRLRSPQAVPPFRRFRRHCCRRLYPVWYPSLSLPHLRPRYLHHRQHWRRLFFRPLYQQTYPQIFLRLFCRLFCRRSDRVQSRRPILRPLRLFGPQIRQPSCPVHSRRPIRPKPSRRQYRCGQP
jgi:hypothetical protein